MKILAFDTSNKSLSVALLEDQKILQFINSPENNNQAEDLVLLLEKVLKDNKIWYNNLDLIATIKGPGSFTGIRIGLSCAKAIKLGTNLPLITLDSLLVLAYKNRNHNGKILAAIDAKMDEFFVAEFFIQNKKIEQTTKSRLVNKEEFLKLAQQHSFVCGTATNIEDKASADFIGLVAYEEFLSGKNNRDTNPSYLRMPKISPRKS